MSVNTNVHSEDYKYLKSLLESLGDSGDVVNVYDRPLDEAYQNQRGIAMSIVPSSISTVEKRNVRDYQEQVSYLIDIRVQDKQYATYTFMLPLIERIKSTLYDSDVTHKINDVEVERQDKDEDKGLWYQMTFTLTTNSVRYPCG